MAGMMLEKFKKYWDVIHEVMGVAAVLDPRYKLNSLEFYFSKVYGRESIVQIDNIKKLFSCLIDEYNEMKRCGETFDSEVLDCSPHTGDIESEFQMFISNKRAKVAVEETDFDRYLKEAPIPPSPSFDLLLWWKVNGWKYPSLMSIAKDVLAIPVSSVASESAFSAGGRLVSPHRSRLHPKTVEALMCAQSWLSTIEEDGQAPFVSDGYCTVLEDYTEDIADFSMLDD
uniref:Transposase n=1 Tax=Kalanchoe fedtschenkoi TaxID=63787 RepID=A0A7N0SZQ4_KALFE